MRHDIVTLGMFPVRENAPKTPIRVRSGGVVGDTHPVFIIPPQMGGFGGEFPPPQILAKPSVPPQIGTPKFSAGRIVEH